jgi:hypothetical protein
MPEPLPWTAMPEPLPWTAPSYRFLSHREGRPVAVEKLARATAALLIE